MRDIRFYPGRDGLERYGLGPTEASLMAYLWDCTSPRTLGQVFECRNGGRKMSTIQTTLNRLAVKGLLIRDGRGEMYRYRPTQPRDEWEAAQRAAVQAALDATE